MQESIPSFKETGGFSPEREIEFLKKKLEVLDAADKEAAALHEYQQGKGSKKELAVLGGRVVQLGGEMGELEKALPKGNVYEQPHDRQFYEDILNELQEKLFKNTKEPMADLASQEMPGLVPPIEDVIGVRPGRAGADFESQKTSSLVPPLEDVVGIHSKKENKESPFSTAQEEKSEPVPTGPEVPTEQEMAPAFGEGDFVFLNRNGERTSGWRVEKMAGPGNDQVEIGRIERGALGRERYVRQYVSRSELEPAPNETLFKGQPVTWNNELGWEITRAGELGVDDRVEIQKKEEIVEPPRGLWGRIKNIFKGKQERIVKKIVSRKEISVSPYLQQ